MQRCAACARHVFYPRLACSHCGSVDLHWQAPSGRGTVYAVSVVNRSAEKGGPYNVVLVDLAEGAETLVVLEGILTSARGSGSAQGHVIDLGGPLAPPPCALEGVVLVPDPRLGDVPAAAVEPRPGVEPPSATT